METIISILIMGGIIGIVSWVYKEYFPSHKNIKENEKTPKYNKIHKDNDKENKQRKVMFGIPLDQLEISNPSNIIRYFKECEESNEKENRGSVRIFGNNVFNSDEKLLESKEFCLWAKNLCFDYNQFAYFLDKESILLVKFACLKNEKIEDTQASADKFIEVSISNGIELGVKLGWSKENMFEFYKKDWPNSFVEEQKSSNRKLDPTIDISTPLSIVEKSMDDYSTFVFFSKSSDVKIVYNDNRDALTEFVIFRLAILNFFLSTKLGSHQSNLIMDKLVPNTFVGLFTIMEEGGYSGSENTFFSECQSVYNKRQSLYSVWLKKDILNPETITGLSFDFSDVLYHYYDEVDQSQIYMCVKLNILGIISSTLKIAVEIEKNRTENELTNKNNLIMKELDPIKYPTLATYQPEQIWDAVANLQARYPDMTEGKCLLNLEMDLEEANLLARG